MQEFQQLINHLNINIKPNLIIFKENLLMNKYFNNINKVIHIFKYINYIKIIHNR